MKFKELGITENVLSAISDEQFSEPTEIQRRTIPVIAQGKDVIGESKTGSGKTLAFATAVIPNTRQGAGVQSLVLTPTRELAVQVTKELKKFSKYKHLKVISVYGGVGIEPQIKSLETADVVVATPGRLLDHMSRQTVDLNMVNTLVLDEADRMLDMGFLDDIERIISVLPKQRQTLLFSATIRTDINHLVHRYMKDPVKISVEHYVDPTLMHQCYYDVQDNMKFSLLVHLLKQPHDGLAMVFCNTRRNVDFIAEHLKKNGITAIAMHGGFSQARRQKTIEQFKGKSIGVLVCTDVAARGLDIKGVSHIYNYDIPSDSKEYVHRIGRTARAGKKGQVVNIIASRDHENFSNVFRYYDFDIVKEQTPYVKRVIVQKSGGRRGQARPRRRFTSARTSR